MRQRTSISRKALINACISLAFVLLLSKFGDCDSGTVAMFQFPDGCSSSGCDYTATIMVDTVASTMSVALTGTQTAGTWIGIGFGVTPLMETTEVFAAYIDSSSASHVMNLWIADHYTVPQQVATSSVMASSVSYVNGEYNFTFTRSLASSDTTEHIDFTAQQALYVKLPEKGGTMSGSTLQKHLQTPHVSPSTVCICAAGILSTLASGGSTVSGGSMGPSSMGPSGGSMGPTSMGPSGGSMGPTSMGPSGGSMGPSSMGPSGGSMGPTSMGPSGGSMGPTSMGPSGGSMGPSSMGPSGGSMGPTSMGPSGGSMGPSVGSMGPSMGPSGGPSMGPSGGPGTMGPSMGPSGGPGTMGPSMGPSGGPGTMGPSGGPAGPTTMGGENGGGSSHKSRTAKITLIATLVTFGCLCLLVFFVWCFCFAGPVAAAPAGF